MAFQSSTLVNGEWTTRTVDVDTVLRHHDQQDMEVNAVGHEVEKTPKFGLLTQTVIRSPLVHWILPAKLRGPNTNDVAFIGENFVQIKELRGDGILWNVIRKENFGARIRNARIVGSMKEYEKGRKAQGPETQIKDENGDVDMDLGDDMPRNQPKHNVALPPQFIVLQVDTGDTIFLMLRQSKTGKLAFITTSRRRVTKMMLELQPGMHLTVDPSSRYMAIGCSEQFFAIYALHSRDNLTRQYDEGSNPQHIEAETHIYTRGLIHKMEFLHPSAEGEIILLVLIIFKGKSRMMVYEWKTGDDMKRIRPVSFKGEPLVEAQQMPLLLIPLRPESTFILVCENCMALVSNIRKKVKCVEFNTRVEKPTPLHHGSGKPLWVSWARPAVRMHYYNAARDGIYIAREDGLVKFLEIEAEDIIEAGGDMNVGDFENHCGPALACLDYRNYENTTGDLLVTGGDSSAGGAYLIQARMTPVFIQPIQNWTPAQDFVTTSTGQKQSTALSTSARAKYGESPLPTPDRIFACVGKGAKGAITEFRYGLEARIGLEADYDLPILSAWSLSAASVKVDDVGGSLFLLSLGDSTVALYLKSDETKIEVLDNSATKLDLRFRTITASTQGNNIIQVTEQSIIVIDEFGSHVYEGDMLLSIHDENHTIGLGTAINDAAIFESIVLFTTYLENAVYLKVLEPNSGLVADKPDDSGSNSNSSARSLGIFSAHVTGLAVCRIERTLCAIIAECIEDSVTLAFQPVHEGFARRILDITSAYADGVHLEAIVSIAVAVDPSSNTTMLCGTRNGFLLTVELDESKLQIVNCGYDRIGATSVVVKRDYYSYLAPQQIFFVSCNSKAYTMALDMSVKPSSSKFRRNCINQIWVTDALRPGFRQPNITAVVRQIPNISSGMDCRILLIAESQLLFAGLNMEAKAVPRQMQIGGTPTRLLYSRMMEVIVVAAAVNGKSTLLFIDPDTGDDLSSPRDQKGGPVVDFISGLGNTNERVFRLFEWSYVKNGKTWDFIIAATNTGRLLIISIENQDLIRKEIGRPNGHTNGTGNSSPRSKIAYFTKNKFKCHEPVYSVAGFSDGLLWGTGEMLYCDILDLSEKRFRRVAEYELPSVARNLEFDNGTIYALTQEHSLEVLQLVTEDGGSYKIIRTHGDQLSRYALNHIVIDRFKDRPLHLISDKESSLVGLWPTENTKADTLETVFEGQLPYSVLRFRSSKCRPVWDPSWDLKRLQSREVVDLGYPANSLSSQEVLGLSIDGSLSRYAILDIPAWKFLRFLINLCLRSPKICEFTYHDGPPLLDVADEPKIMMHIDGDILKRCLDEQGLEELLYIGQNSEEASSIFSRFCELLQDLHGGSLEKNTTSRAYVEQAYRDLEIYLRPVL